MGRVLDEITADLAELLVAQPVFFVGTAPEGADGRIDGLPVLRDRSTGA